MFKGPLSLRRSLVLNLIFVLVLLGTAMLVAELLIERHIIRRLANVEATNSIALVQEHYDHFIEPIEVLFDATAYRIRSGLFPENWLTGDLDPYFQAFIGSIPQLSSINLADLSGDSYMLLHTGNDWESRISKPETWGNRTRWREWTNEDRTPKESWREIDYDARARPWYKSGAAQIANKNSDTPIRELIQWTEPHEFFTTKRPGVTASVAVKAPDGRSFFLALNIFIEDLSKYTTNLRVGESGMVFVLAGDPGSKDARLIGLPSDPRFKGNLDIQKYILRAPHELGGPVADFTAHVSEPGKLEQFTPVEFYSKGQKWWGMARRWDISTERPMWIGMVISEQDLLRGIPNLTAWLIGVTALFLLLAVIRGVRLARTFSDPIDGLVRQGERMQRLNFQPSEPVNSRIVEIKLLATTLERMRQALFSFSSVREDIRIAHSIRRAILPAPMPTMPGFEIEAWCEPSSEVGGEAYDVVDFWVNRQTPGRSAGPADGVALFIFDAAGLGVNTAVKGSQLRAIFRTGVRLGVDLPVLAEQMNQHLRNDAPDSGPVLSWYGLLNRSDSQLTSLCLGQEPVLRYSAAERRFHHLDNPSSALGFEEQITAMPIQSVRLESGDIIVIASDGVVDTMNPAREKFGIERIKEVVIEHQQADGKQILERLRQALTEFHAGSATDEDRTIVLIKCV